jgi:hypothetical protein
MMMSLHQRQMAFSARHSRESGNPCCSIKKVSCSGRFYGLNDRNDAKNKPLKSEALVFERWIPAFAGMTQFSVVFAKRIKP